MINKGMFSSKTDEWYTPQSFFDKYDNEFKFELDVCADDLNHKCSKYYTKKNDALTKDWKGICWMNPPYGRSINKWIKKAYDSAIKGATVVCLLPSRTDTKWFQDYCLMSNDIRFIRGRIKFGGSTNSAPFPSVIVVFSPKTIKKVGVTNGRWLL